MFDVHCHFLTPPGRADRATAPSKSLERARPRRAGAHGADGVRHALALLASGKDRLRTASPVLLPASGTSGLGSSRASRGRRMRTKEILSTGRRGATCENPWMPRHPQSSASLDAMQGSLFTKLSSRIASLRGDRRRSQCLTPRRWEAGSRAVRASWRAPCSSLARR